MANTSKHQYSQWLFECDSKSTSSKSKTGQMELYQTYNLLCNTIKRVTDNQHNGENICKLFNKELIFRLEEELNNKQHQPNEEMGKESE